MEGREGRGGGLGERREVFEEAVGKGQGGWKGGRSGLRCKRRSWRREEGEWTRGMGMENEWKGKRRRRERRVWMGQREKKRTG